MDAKKHAKWLVAGTKVLFYNFFYGALSDKRTAEEKDLVTDKLFHRLEGIVAQTPDDYSLAIPAVVLMCTEKVF